jgi:hypothetical protein
MDKRIKVYTFILITIFLAIPSNGEITYSTQSRLFVGEIEQEMPHKKINVIRPFVVLPNRSLGSSARQLDFFRFLFNFEAIILKEEADELEWKPQYRKDKAIFPRIVQTVKVERDKFEICLIPFITGVSIGFRIKISLVKSTPEGKRDVLSQLQAVYDETSKGSILNTEIMNFGNLFFICFPKGKRIYILSFYYSSMSSGVIY